MKRILFTLALLFQFHHIFAQSAIQVKADSVKIRNAELVIENQSKNVPGVLFNKGNGRTEFRKLDLKNIGDTALAIVGQDTLLYSGGGGGASGKSVQFKAGISQGYPAAGDSTYTNTDFISKNVKVWRNGLFQYRDPNDGVLVDSTAGKITFRPALIQGERVYIEAMSGISLVFTLPPVGFSTNLTKLNAGAFDNGDNTFTLRWATNNNTLSLSPRVVGIGSSTLEGHGLAYPNRLGDKIAEWFNQNATNALWSNLAVGGYTSVQLLPVAQGGSAGHNIDSALNYNPDFIFVSLPSNDVATNGSSTATILANYRKLDTMALNKGIPILWETTQPRDQLNATQQTQLKTIADSVRAIWPTRFVEGFNNLVNTSAPTDAVTRTEYALGDGVHINALGVIQVANSLFARFQSYFQPIIGVSGYVIEASANGSSWSTFDEVTNSVIVKKNYTKQSGLQYFRVKANYTNGTSSPYSNIATYFGNGGGTAPTVTVADATITLPTSSVQLTGNISANGNNITGYQWTQISGPNTATMGTPNAVNCTMGGLASGSYVFRLTITVSGTATYSDNATVTVNAGAGTPTVTVADATITLPTNSVALTGNVTANGSNITGYLWTQVSGPNTATMGTNTAVNCTMSNLAMGSYVFRLTITVSGTTTYSDDATVTVNNSSGTPPTVTVADATVTLPTSSTTLTGNITANGNTITGYQWTQLPLYSANPAGIGGPNTVTFGTATAVSTTVSGLTNGVFTLRLTITVSGGATYSDDVTVTVLPDNGGKKTLRAYFSNTAVAAIPGWVNVYGPVSNSNVSITDPVTSWSINNGGNTGIYWSIFGGANGADNAGQQTGNNSGVIPDRALANYWFNYSTKYTTNDNVNITGLNPAKTYTLKLVASRSTGAAAPRYAAWRINGGSEILQNAWGNTSTQEVLTGVVPNSSGVIRIAVYAPGNDGTYGQFTYINALIVVEE